jgi:hypothetical protein
MGEKIVVGPMAKGLKTNPLAFYIDNDSFPQLINAYPWRGRVKRRRGTSQLGQLQRIIGTTDGSGNATITISPHPIAIGVVTFTVGTNIFTDPGGASPVTLLTTGPGTATLNRSTGVLTILGSNLATSVVYFPGLPVMGLEDLNLTGMQFPGTIAFDTVYSYNIATAFPYTISDVSFYKNPASGTYASYVAKGTLSPLWWNGQNYQQFWTTNYEGALWATNGITVPFNPGNIGMQFKPIVTVDNITGGPPAVARLHITAHGLVKGDFVFVNEVVTTTGINFQTGYVTSNDPQNANFVDVTFPNATIATNGSGGIAQYLTSNVAAPTKDVLRWYDGNPAGGSGLGWVNFMPPLFSGIPPFGIEDLPPSQYYLVGAQMVLPFKDRLLFFGPVVQSSTTGPFYLQDVVIYSQNGTPYYTASFTGSPISPTTVYNPILVPLNQTATANAWFEDVTGFGGFLAAGFQSAITSVSPNEDALIVGFTNRQTRLLYTGNDIVPFNFFVINSELGTGSTFSIINLDRGVISIGDHGIVLTSQIASQRIDIDIPDQVFQFNLSNNGTQRITAQRDFINEWIYFTFPDNEVPWVFPNQTLIYNYREDLWGLFNEVYTTYGQFRKSTGFTWATIGTVFPTWAQWNEPWNSGSSTLFQPEIIAGNQQGFIFIRDDGTSEEPSLNIANISGVTVTSVNHSLNNGDYIIINGAQGTIGQFVNGQTFQVFAPTTNSFTIIGPSIPSGTYTGGGTITRIYIPFIQTKQFPVAWSIARKTRLGVQQYLLSTTSAGQVQLLIFLSQNSSDPYNLGNIVPADTGVVNDALIYSTVVYTCPESTNLGLTPSNINLQMLTAQSPFQQDQIWHRMNTSLIGDTVQMAITISPEQIKSLTPTNITAPITAITNAYPAVITTANAFSVGQLVQISGVLGMPEINNSTSGRNYQITAASTSSISINFDTTTFGVYTSGGTATIVTNTNAFSEVELHGFILDVSPSSLLA